MEVRDDSPQATTARVLAFDIGGTRAKAGVIIGDQVRGQTSSDTSGCRTAEAVFDMIERLGLPLVGAHGPVDALGISVRGVVEPGTGVVVDVNEPLTCLIGQPLGEIVGNRFGVEAWVDNDARMYTVGELVHGAGRGSSNLVCLTLGTGVGVGVVIDGHVLKGPRGTRGILGGHITIDADGPQCSCGNIGCLETLIGADAFVKQVQATLDTGVRSSLKADELDTSQVFASSRRGDAVARQAVDRFAHILGCGVVTLIHVYDPDVVVIGGGLSAAAGEFMPAVHAWTTEHAWTRPRGRVAIRVAKLGDTAALIGTAHLASSTLATW